MATDGPSRWRKLPVEIEALQWNPGDLLQAGAMAGWLMMAGADFHHPSGMGETTTLAIRTLEGEMLARPGWWIIRGVAGEFYPCAPDVFEATYESADSPRPTPRPSDALHADGPRTGAGTEAMGMYQRAYWDVQRILDEALGTEDGDGAGEGIAADVALLADRFKRAEREAERLKRIVDAGRICAEPLPLGEETKPCPVHGKDGSTVAVSRDDLRLVLRARELGYDDDGDACARLAEAAGVKP